MKREREREREREGKKREREKYNLLYMHARELREPRWERGCARGPLAPQALYTYSN